MADKEEKKEMTNAERKEARAALVQLLLIVLIAVAIAYLGFNLGVGILAFVLWLAGRAVGVA